MRARIRYGNEADILEAVAGSGKDALVEDLNRLRAVSSTVLSFSATVGHIPDMPAFDSVVENLGIQFRQLPSLENYDPVVQMQGRRADIFGENARLLPPTIKVIEVTNPDEITVDRLKALAQGLFELANRSEIDNDGILFVDHSVVPSGDVIAAQL